MLLSCQCIEQRCNCQLLYPTLKAQGKVATVVKHNSCCCKSWLQADYNAIMLLSPQARRDMG